MLRSRNTPAKGPAARPVPKNQPGTMVLTEVAKGHAKSDAKRDMGSEMPSQPSRSLGMSGSSAPSKSGAPTAGGNFGHAQIPSRFQSTKSSAPPIKMGGAPTPANRDTHPAAAPKPMQPKHSAKKR